MTGPKKGSRGRAPKRNTAQGRGGITRDAVRPARERTTSRGSEVDRAGKTDRSPEARSGGARGEGARRQTTGSAQAGRPGGGAARTGAARSGSTPSGPAQSGSGRSAGKPARRAAGEGRRGERDERTAGARPFKPAAGRKVPTGRRPLPELKRVQLDAPPPDTVFVDRDGERLSFPDSNLKRVAAAVLSEKRKAWRYRPFSFPLFTDSGHEQAFHFDFYVYDAEDSVIRLLLVVPFESREVWDRVGRFKRQYPMYTYELWTPERLAQLSGPRGRLNF